MELWNIFPAFKYYNLQKNNKAFYDLMLAFRENYFSTCITCNNVCKGFVEFQNFFDTID